MARIPAPKTYRFSRSSTQIHYNGRFSMLSQLCQKKSSVLITDENVYTAQKKKFAGWNIIVLRAGEENKVQTTIDAVVEQMIDMRADRSTMVIGVGGGMVTDIAGYVASIYMRGLPFGFVPTSLLGLVDASLGGKNGVDVGAFKNLVGTIRQPGFILHDYSLLNTLPIPEWRNGFAEIIKHAAIASEKMFRLLESMNLENFRRDVPLLSSLVMTNAQFKMKLVAKDEFEKKERRILNFGHTLGHALEKTYELSHGEAISIGMNVAAKLSASLTGFRDQARIAALLGQYGLPSEAVFEKKKIFDVMFMDKKRSGDKLHYVLLKKIGAPVVIPISVKSIQRLIAQIR
jgi:3-dehydroquinate synthase